MGSPKTPCGVAWKRAHKSLQQRLGNSKIPNDISQCKLWEALPSSELLGSEVLMGGMSYLNGSKHRHLTSWCLKNICRLL